MNTKHTKVLKIYNEKLKYFNYSVHTIKIYDHYTQKFLEKTDKYPQHLTSADFTSYLTGYNYTSVSQQNQVISAIKFLYEKVLNKKYAKIDFQRPKKEHRLPQIIDKQILKTKILAIQNLKHKAILSLAYSCGLRVSEIINLKIKDIDSQRMLINIHLAKGRKDRIVPLSVGLLEILRNYFKVFKPKEYLFNGQFKNQYTASSCNQIIKKYINAKAHMHQLRHSCFTHLLESGIDLRIIQSIAGHKNVKTTEIYTHVSNNMLQNVAMPI